MIFAILPFVILIIFLALSRYQKHRAIKKLRKAERDLQLKMEKFEKELREYRTKRDQVKVRRFSPAE